MRAIKAVKQTYRPTSRILVLLEQFRQMVNDCLMVGLKFEEENRSTPSMKKLSLLCYGQLKRYEVCSAYRLTAISKAAGILSARRKSTKRGFFTRTPYASRPLLVSCYNVKVQDRKLRVHLGDGQFEDIPLNARTLRVLSHAELRINSFTLTATSLSICFSKEDEAEPVAFTDAVGIDRNLRNLTVGNENRVTYYDMAKAVEIARAPGASSVHSGAAMRGSYDRSLRNMVGEGARG